MTNRFAKFARVIVTTAVMTAMVVVSASAVKVTAKTDTAVHAKASSTSATVATMKSGTTRKVLKSTKTWYKIKVNGKTGYVKKRAVSIADEPNVGDSIVEIAKQQLGKPYKWGGTGPDEFDVSGFVQYVYKQKGWNIPRSIAKQYEGSIKVEKADLKPGQLVFFGTNAGDTTPTYVGIYIGDNQFISVSSKKGSVVTNSLTSKYYKARFIGGGKYE